MTPEQAQDRIVELEKALAECQAHGEMQLKLRNDAIRDANELRVLTAVQRERIIELTQGETTP